ncbi:MAG: alpha-D-glucose phosphate-specific phosphoglucomutase, partial [Megasphaera micronuciformis]|nr:alpha-D-glucose phosphate-specific phosphoglucomutase [Megasphaera micronuciformis]
MSKRDERIVESVSVHPLAGQRVRACDYPDLEEIKEAYNKTIPCMDEPAQRVSFGTSGHRGKATDGSFTA